MTKTHGFVIFVLCACVIFLALDNVRRVPLAEIKAFNRDVFTYGWECAHYQDSLEKCKSDYPSIFK